MEAERLQYHLEAKELAALLRGDATERDEVEADANRVAVRVRRPVEVVGGGRVWMTVDPGSKFNAAHAALGGGEKGRAPIRYR